MHPWYVALAFSIIVLSQAPAQAQSVFDPPPLKARETDRRTNESAHREEHQYLVAPKELLVPSNRQDAIFSQRRGFFAAPAVGAVTIPAKAPEPTSTTDSLKASDPVTTASSAKAPEPVAPANSGAVPEWTVLGLPLTDDKIKAAYTDYVIARIEAEKRNLASNRYEVWSSNISSNVIFLAVHACLGLAVVAAVAEFQAARKSRKKSVTSEELEVSMQKIALKTSLHGTFLLGLALFLYWLYVTLVYPIKVF